MGYLRKLSFSALFAVVLLACVGVGTASATTLEIGGVAQNQAVTIEGSLEENSKTIWETTTGQILEICEESTIKGKTEGAFTGGATVGGKVSTLTFGECLPEVKVLKPGSFTVEWISNTKGTVKSSGTEVEFEDEIMGIMLTCSTGASTDLGLLTGVAAGNATLEINAVINCGFFRPSVIWKAAYTITSPQGLGVIK